MSKQTLRDVATLQTGLAVAVVVGMIAVGAFAIVAASPAAADHGTAGNYTVVLPEDTDHLPGDQNEENASMQQFSSGADSFEEHGAPEGFETLDYIEVWQEEIDFSACGSSNTAVFGVDRGNNNSGTQTDDDLLQHMKESRFKEHRIEVEFYEDDDLGGDPTYLNPEDAIVSVQGAGSAAGPCFTMPTEPGWYQMNGLMQGTTEDGEEVTIESGSHYFPICEGCHDEDTAREKLGPPPSEDGGGGGAGGEESQDEETGDEGAGEQEASDEETEEEQAGDGEESGSDDATEEPGDDAAGDDGSGDGAADDDAADDEQAGDDATEDAGGAAGDDGSGDGAADDDGDAPAEGADDNETPSGGDGPGFGAIGAVVALLASALLVDRRN